MTTYLRAHSKSLAVVPFIIAGAIAQGLVSGNAAKWAAIVLSVFTYFGVYSAPKNEAPE